MDGIDEKVATEVAQARSEVVAALNSMRYGGGVTSAVVRSNAEIDEAEFLMSITAWMIALNKVLANVSETTTEMAEELYNLRSQRKALRDLMGIATDSVVN